MKFIKKKKAMLFGILIIFLILASAGFYFYNQTNDSLNSSKKDSKTSVDNNEPSPTSPTGPTSSTGFLNDVNCVVTYPDTWGPCSASGVKTATGTITTYPSGNGEKCGPLTITSPCPVDCVVNWGA